MNYRVFIIIGWANQAGKIVLILPDNLSGAWPLSDGTFGCIITDLFTPNLEPSLFHTSSTT